MTKPFVDPHMAQIMSRLQVAPPVVYETMGHSEGQAFFHATARQWNTAPPEIGGARDLKIPTGYGQLLARYVPLAAPAHGLIIALHGGGWTFGSIDSHDRMYRLLGEDAGCAVLSVDYRLAPEHPFPAGLEDALQAIQFAEQGGLGSQVAARKIALAGDSAGANIALATLVRRRELGLPPLAGAALFYGCFEPTMKSASHNDFGDGRFGLSLPRMQWYWRNYLGSERESTTSLAAPLRAEFRGLPPLHLVAAGLDLLRDDTIELGARLAQADVPFTLSNVPGVVHGFAQMSAELPLARDAIAMAGARLSNLITKEAA